MNKRKKNYSYFNIAIVYFLVLFLSLLHISFPSLHPSFSFSFFSFFLLFFFFSFFSFLFFLFFFFFFLLSFFFFLFFSVLIFHFLSFFISPFFSFNTAPFLSSTLCLMILLFVRLFYSILPKEVTSITPYTLHFLQKKLPVDWPRQSFCWWKASDRLTSAW